MKKFAKIFIVLIKLFEFSVKKRPRILDHILPAVHSDCVRISSLILVCVAVDLVDVDVNRVILYDDKVIILYNSNDREVKRLTKKQLKEAENAENLEEIKENSSEPCEFKRVALAEKEGFVRRNRRFRRNSVLLDFLLFIFLSAKRVTLGVRSGRRGGQDLLLCHNKKHPSSGAFCFGGEGGI